MGISAHKCVSLRLSFNTIRNTLIMRQYFLLPIFLFCVICVQAQINMPQPSPSSTLIQNVGLAEVKVEYSRPSAKGRKVMGGIVAYGEVWRTGANAATKFTTNDSLTFMGKGLAKGSYILTTRPGQDSWEIMFNKNLTSSSFNPKPDDEVLKVSVKPQMLPLNIETFTMQIGNVSAGAATLDIMWENTLVSVPFTNAYEEKVVTQIKQKLEGPSQNEYYTMSQFYFDTGRSLSEALNFVNKAIEKGERFWMLRHKSLIQAKLGDKAGAIATAKRSLELAKEAKNNDYVRMNEASIAEWSK